MLDESDAIGQVRQGIMMGHMFDTGLSLLTLGNIFRKAKEVAPFAGLVRDRKIFGCQDSDTVVTSANRVLGDGLQVLRSQGLVSEREQVFRSFLVGWIMRPSADQVAARYPKNSFGGPVDEDIAPISCILDGNRQGHVFDDGIEKFLGATELCSGRIESLQLPKMNKRDRQARKCQSEEETQSDAGALSRYGAQKRRHRDVNHERADNVVEMPLRFIGLENVVTANATLFVRDGRIDCAEHQFPIDIQQL